MKKSIPTADVRGAIMRHISIWLKLAAEDDAEARSADIGSRKWERADDDSYRHMAMARALYMMGEGLGVVSATDYPQFGRREEKQP